MHLASLEQPRGSTVVETEVLTRRELEDLVAAISAEVVRRMSHPEGRGNPEPVSASPHAIRLTSDARALASLIDHTQLRPEATRAQVEQFCDEALEAGFAAGRDAATGSGVACGESVS